MAKNKLAIEAIRKQIQRIAFDANIYDRGLGDYPYAQKCSKKRKELEAQIQALQGETVDLPKDAKKTRRRTSRGQTQGQMTLF